MRKVLLFAFLAAFTLGVSIARVDAATSLIKEPEIEKLMLQTVADVQAGGYKVISVEELKKMLDAGEDVALIDAHPAWEYDLAYVDGAVNIGFQGKPSDKWEDNVADGHTKAQFLAALGPDKSRKVVAYCGFVL